MKLLSKREKIAITSIALVWVCVFSFVGYAFLIPQPKEIVLERHLKSLTPELVVRVYDSNGVLKAEERKDGDLVLNNFMIILRAIVSTGVYYVDPLKDITNTARTTIIKSQSSFGTSNLFYTTGAHGGMGRLGTGTNSPTFADYELQTPVETILAVSDPVYANGNLTVSLNSGITASRTITEAGFYFRSGTSTNYFFLLFRDTFNGISVVNGDTVVTTWTLMLDTSGFTDNLGYMLATMLTYDTSTTQVYPTVKNTAGLTLTLNWYAASGGTNMFTTLASVTDSANIVCGTSSTAFSRSDYSINSIVGNPMFPSEAGINQNLITISGVQVFDAETTINEVAYYSYLKQQNASTYHWVCLWREVVTPKTVAANVPVTISFTIQAN